jgi:hypothetical protein
MNYFCSECAAKPGWHFDHRISFQHSCQRCFRNRPCNDYTKSDAPKVSHAPAPKELVRDAVNPHAEVNLPKAKGHVPTPQPVYPVPPPTPIGATSDCPNPDVAPCAPPVIPQGPDLRNEVDKALDAVQPNRPGVKLESVDKTGRKLSTPAAKPQHAKPKPEFEVADEVKDK